MLAVRTIIYALEWAQGAGGLHALIARADSNAAALDAWVKQTPWIEHLAADPAIRQQHQRLPALRPCGGAGARTPTRRWRS
jgi:phosphoserine aminotransferase